jgi:hypothetical protein
MTRSELTGIRELNFSQWIRDNLPDSSLGFVVSDLDFIVSNYKTKRIMLLEIKTRNAQLKTWQQILFNNLAKWIKQGIDKDWEFLGFHTITFQNTFFNDGNVYLDNIEITEQKLAKFLELKNT